MYIYRSIYIDRERERELMLRWMAMCVCMVQVTVDGVKHIVVFAKRPLVKGEEISKIFYFFYLS